MQIFSKKEAVNTGWNLTKTNLGFIALVYAIYIGVTMGISFLEMAADKFMGAGLLAFNLYIVSFLVSCLLAIGILKIFLDLYDGKKGELSDLFTKYEQYFSFLLASILVFLIVLGGVILLVVPGIIWALKYQFTPYLIVDRKMKPMAAIKMSGKITYGHKVNLFLFYWVIIGLNILGFLCCCIGVFFTILITMFAYVHIYRKLLADYEAAKSQSNGNPISENGPIEEETPVLTSENAENKAPAEEKITPEKPVPPVQ